MRASEFRQRPPDVIDVAAKLGTQAVLNLQVDRNKVTRYWADSADDNFYVALMEVVVGWDLVNDDGSPYPITVENWVDLRLTLQDEFDLVEQIVVASVPSRAEGNVLSTASSVTPQANTDSRNVSSTFQNGSATTPLPSDSVAQPTS